MRRFGDHAATRDAVYDNAMSAFQNLPPVENSRYKMTFSDPGWAGPAVPTVADHKAALLTGRTLGRRLTATVGLVDKASGTTVDARRMTVASVPQLTNQGTFVVDGNPAALSHQLRLLPGAFVRRKASGETSTHFNFLPGQGVPHQVVMDPATGVFRTHVGQAEIPTVSLLRAFGATDDDLNKYWGDWGPEILAANLKADKPHHLARYWEKFGAPGPPPPDLAQALVARLSGYKMDPWVTRRTLGHPHAAYGKLPLLAATRKMIAVNRGEADPDDRDNPAYSAVWGPEHLIAERIARAGPHLAKHLWQVTNAGSLKRLQPGFLTPAVRGVFTHSGLALAPEGVSAAEYVDHGARITKVGEGGIGKSAESVPMSARAVSPGQFPFIDSIRTSECFDVETEVNTYGGWKRWADVTTDDRLACMVDGTIQFERPERLHVYDYDGLMYGAKNRYIDYLVTPNHRFWCSLYCKPATQKWRWRTAEELHDRTEMHRTSGYEPYPGDPNFTVFCLPQVEADVPDLPDQSAAASRRFVGTHRVQNLETVPIAPFCELLGWYLGEGSFRDRRTSSGPQYSVVISQSEEANPQKCARIAALLDELGITWTYQPSTQAFMFCGKQWVKYFNQFGYSGDRFIPEVFFAAPSAARRRLFDALLSAEGTTNRYGRIESFNTTSPQLATDFARLAFSLGYSTSTAVHPDDRQEHYRDCYRVTWHTRDTRLVQKVTKRPGRLRSGDHYTVHYTGKVYCATVPGGMLYVRRGDSPGMWTGNSESVGVDLRVAFGTRLGADKNIYAPVFDGRTGKLVFKSPRDLADATLAFPGALQSGDPVVPAVRGGKLTHVPRHEVDYHVPSMEQSFSPLTNMVPIKSASKPHRSSMGSRMISQSLPLTNAEAPLVRTQVPNQPGRSFEELFGRHMGAVFARPDQPGVVEAVAPTGVVVRYADGRRETHELYDNHPSGRKTALTNEPLVRPGQQVLPGQILAKSNYTDHTGTAAYGKNLRTAFMIHSSTYEDSIGVSASAAEKLRSDHLYRHTVQAAPDVVFGREAHAAAFPGKHPLAVLRQFGDDGVIKPGAVVNHGDPLILAVRRKAGDYGRLSRSGKAALADASETWEHEEPGVVTDVVQTRFGPSVVVKTTKRLHDGDKISGRHGNKGVVVVIPDDEMPRDAQGRPVEVILSSLGTISRCYDAETEFLTSRGWCRGVDVLPTDEFVAFDPVTGNLEVSRQYEPIHVTDYDGPMYYFAADHLDLAVTPGHRMWSRVEIKGAKFAERPVEDLAFKRHIVPVTGNPIAGTDTPFTLPTWEYGKYHQRHNHDVVIDARDWAAFLGWYLAEGNCTPTEGKTHLSQSDVANPEKCKTIDALLARLPFKFHYSTANKQFHLYSRRLAEYCAQFGLSHEKFIPDWVFRQSYATRQAFLDAMWAGDGSVQPTNTGVLSHCSSTSRRLADDIQRLLMYQGVASIVRPRPPDKRYRPTAQPMWRCGVMLKMRERSLADRRHPTGGWEIKNYTGKVYCPTVRTGFVVVRRNGKPIVAGNTNPSAIFEAHLGKIAERTGKPYVFDDFVHGRDVGDYVRGEAARHGVPFMETLTDPKTGRPIPNVGVGMLYVMKLHHLSAGKAKGRGLGGYDESGQPLRGQSGKAMRASMGDTNALVSHGASKVLHDAHIFRGQDNPEFWASYMAGFPPVKPHVSKPFERFLSELRAAGIDPVHRDGRYHLTALTDDAIKKLAVDREVTSGETLDLSRDGKPIPGGLMDPAVFGTTDSTGTWGKVTLHEPVVSPVFEEPVRRLLGLTGRQFRDVVAGRHALPTGATGMAALVSALRNYDVPGELAKARRQVESARKTVRDDAARKLKYLAAMDRNKTTPADWVASAVPVLPPGYRPVNPGRGGGENALVHDQNYLYADLINANHALRDLSKEVDDVGAERLNLYDAVAAAYGLGDPVGAKNRERGVRGVLARLLGDSGKSSFMQTKLLGTPVNLSGRAAALPDMDLDMDQIGVPHSVAWDVYHPFVVRRLVRSGVPRVEAVRQVTDKAPAALRALQAELEVRPILATRYPALHRYAVQAFRPTLAAGDAVMMNHLVTKSYGGDFDGDTYTLSVPLTDEAVAEAYEKMLPSKNLFSPAGRNVLPFLPNMEVVQGHHALTTGDEKNAPVEFRTLKEAKAAEAAGLIGLHTRVRILED